MLYMIIESFKHGDPVPVYRRFRDHGRLAPEGMHYVSSWVTSDMTKCYQLMECEDRRLARMPSPSARHASTRTMSSTATCLP